MPALLTGLAFGGDESAAIPFLVGLVVHVFTASFAALATALLFYDLLARQELKPAPASSGGPEAGPTQVRLS